MEDVDDVLAFDFAWREVRYVLDEVGGEFNKVNKEVVMLMKVGKKDEVVLLMVKVKEIDERKKAAAEKEKELEEKTTTALLKIGNIVYDSVLVLNDEENNVIVCMWGEKCMEEKFLNYVDLIFMLDIVDVE